MQLEQVITIDGVAAPTTTITRHTARFGPVIMMYDGVPPDQAARVALVIAGKVKAALK